MHEDLSFHICFQEEKATRMREAEEKLNEAIKKHMEEKASTFRRAAELRAEEKRQKLEAL